MAGKTILIVRSQLLSLQAVFPKHFRATLVVEFFSSLDFFLLQPPIPLIFVYSFFLLICLTSLNLHLLFLFLFYKSMTTEILDSLDSVSINEVKTECLGLSKSSIDKGKDSCKFSVHMIIFFHAPGLRVAMSKPWKCRQESFKMHMLDENMFQLIFQKSETGDWVLYEGPWNFSKRLFIFHLWNHDIQDPPRRFDLSGLPPWCFTPEIGQQLASILEDPILLEICSSNWKGVVGPFF